MPSEVEHKLAEILSADVVGYSRLMAEDEDETVRRLGAYRTEITNLVGEHRGREGIENLRPESKAAVQEFLFMMKTPEM